MPMFLLCGPAPTAANNLEPDITRGSTQETALCPILIGLLRNISSKTRDFY